MYWRWGRKCANRGAVFQPVADGTFENECAYEMGAALLLGNGQAITDRPNIAISTPTVLARGTGPCFALYYESVSK